MINVDILCNVSVSCLCSSCSSCTEVLLCVLLHAELRVAFAMVDKNGDGRITPRELMTVMTGLGFKSDDVLVKQMIACFDADGNCYICLMVGVFMLFVVKSVCFDLAVHMH